MNTLLAVLILAQLSPSFCREDGGSTTYPIVDTPRPIYMAVPPAEAPWGSPTVTLTDGAKQKTLALVRVEKLEVALYHWPATTLNFRELADLPNHIYNDALWSRPWGVYATGDPEWPVVYVYEASAPCAVTRRRGAGR